jgi:RNA polymerase sigma-70 factor (ECF subfamily)
MDPDRDLVARARGGELHAFEQLVQRHRDVVFRVVVRIVGPGEAEDTAQDAFLRAFHRLDRFRGEGTFRSWLLQIAHNAALNALQRRRPEPVDPLAEGVEPAMTVGGQRTPADRLEARERAERLAGKLQSLSSTHRTVLVLRDVEGLSYEEIAEVTDAPLGSVKGRLHRARGELIELLRRNSYDWELPS